MTDYFALLNEPRRPWLDPEALKQKFLELSVNVHPDRVHQFNETNRKAAHERYTELNAAHNCLREPKDRLRHLLELELGTLPKDMQQPPGNMMDLFLEIGQACRDADAFLTESSGVQSPLLKVQVFERAQNWIEKLNALQQTINGWREQFLEELKVVDAAWMSVAKTDMSQRNELLARLDGLYRLFGFLVRWSRQIQERQVKLSF